MKVFVSYSSSDEKEAKTVAKCLKESGCACWISCEHLNEDHMLAIPRVIAESDVVLLLVSENSKSSPGQETEVKLAEAPKARKDVIPFLLENVDPADTWLYWPLQGYQTIKGYEKGGFEKLVRRLSSKGRLFEESEDKFVRERIAKKPSVSTVIPPASSDTKPTSPFSDYVICPVCGRYNVLTDTFRCKVCGRDHICLEHRSAEQRCCTDCAEKSVWASQVKELLAQALEFKKSGCIKEWLSVVDKVLEREPDNDEAILQREEAVRQMQIIASMQYKIVNGKATIVGSELGKSAISTSTKGEVVIPAYLGENKVTSIGYSAFRGCEGLELVTIPPTVEYIGECAFKDCQGLKMVTIPSTVTCIDRDAFEGCRELGMGVVLANGWVLTVNGECPGKIEMPNDFRRFAVGAINKRRHVTSIVIPQTISNIESLAFAACDGVLSVTIPASVTSIGMYAFAACDGLKTVLIPSAVTRIEACAFKGCRGLESVSFDFAPTIVEIGNEAFSQCGGLKSIDIPLTVEKIGAEAFSRCAELETVIISSETMSIGNDAFYDCQSLKTMAFWCVPPEGLESAGIGEDVLIRYPEKYSQMWLSTIRRCGFTKHQSIKF